MRRFVAVIFVASLMPAWPLYAAEVLFKNGDRLTGKIVKMQEGKLTLNSSTAGTVTVDMAQVRTFSTEGPIKLHLKDGTVVDLKVKASGSGQIAIAGAAGPRAIALADLAAINPPPKPGPKWSGSVAFGYTMTQGNSETETLSVDADVSRRTEKDRTTLKAGWLRARQQSATTGKKETTTDRWDLAGKYDYFVSKKLYVFGNARIEQDKIADLARRLFLGGGPGYQWIETDRVKFSTEAGLGWQQEKFEHTSGAEDRAMAQAGYNFEAALNDNVRFLHDLKYYPSLEDTQDYLVSSSAELRAQITKRIFGSAKVVYDYDSTPAAGAEKSDWTYILGIGINLF